MEELQEADVLWPETPETPPWRDQDHYLYLPSPELNDEAIIAVDFSYESFGSEPTASSSSSTLSALLSDRSSYGFLSDPSTAAGHDDDDVAAEEFQNADVLWPDDVDATREREVDGGEPWWFCCGFRDAGGGRMEPAAGKREAWRPLVSSPIDIPTGAAAALRRARRPCRCTVDSMHSTH